MSPRELSAVALLKSLESEHKTKTNRKKKTGKNKTILGWQKSEVADSGDQVIRMLKQVRTRFLQTELFPIIWGI